jgi:hypothetical protein
MENAKKLSLGIEAVIWGGEENIPLIIRRKIKNGKYKSMKDLHIDLTDDQE